MWSRRGYEGVDTNQRRGWEVIERIKWIFHCCFIFVFITQYLLLLFQFSILIVSISCILNYLSQIIKESTIFNQSSISSYSFKIKCSFLFFNIIRAYLIHYQHQFPLYSIKYPNFLILFHFMIFLSPYSTIPLPSFYSKRIYPFYSQVPQKNHRNLNNNLKWHIQTHFLRRSQPSIPTCSFSFWFGEYFSLRNINVLPLILLVTTDHSYDPK